MYVLLNNYKIGYFRYVRFGKNFITDQRLLNPFIESTNMNTLNYAFVLVKKSDCAY